MEKKMNAPTIKITIDGMEVYDLSCITPEMFKTLDHAGNCVVVTVNGDISRAYVVSWKDKGVDDDGVYYKGCCRRLGNNACGHYEALWFNAKTFRKVVGDFIADGGDLISNTYRRKLVELQYGNLRYCVEGVLTCPMKCDIL